MLLFGCVATFVHSGQAAEPVRLLFGTEFDLCHATLCLVWVAICCGAGGQEPEKLPQMQFFQLLSAAFAIGIWSRHI